MRPRLSVCLAACLVLSSQPGESTSSSTGPFMRGMVVSCPRWGPIWGSPAMAESLAQLGSLGVEWVAIHPYGWLEADGAIRFRPAAELSFLSAAVEHAEDAGMRLFWKPHLGYWGRFTHRGAIAFGDDPSAWARFFRHYEEFIVDQARFAEAARVPLFAVGVELDRTVHYEDVWRRIIGAVRRVYSGTLLYAANWDVVEDVPFWDAVDAVGVHAYFPLSNDQHPDRAMIESGWDAPLRTLESISRRTARPVVLAEIGYTTSPNAARTPWAYATEDSAAARELRTLLIDVALARLERAEFITGMFWWKWIPGDDRRRDFSMRDVEAIELLRRHWGEANGVTTAR